MYDLFVSPGGLIIVHCRITRDTVKYTYIRRSYILYQIRSWADIQLLCGCRLVWCTINRSLICSHSVYNIPFLSFFFFVLFSHRLYVVCLRIPGVRVKYKCLRMFFFFFSSLFFQIISRTGGCLGSRDRDQLQPALTTLTN
jgi:hypothetical protein